MRLSASMRAVQYERYGPSDVLELRTVPVPEPGPDDVLVRVHTSGMNPKDAKVRSGSLRMLSGRAFPRGTGFDFAGEAVATGVRVSDPIAGQRVWGFLDGCAGGAAAEYLVAPRAWMSPMPRRLEWTEAAALPLAGSAALQALRDLARLRAGEHVLVRGACGGVGSAAVQIARAMHARVTALVSAEGLDHARALGADEVLDHRRTDLRRLGRRFHVFLDCVGGSAFRAVWRLLVRGGRWVTVAPVPWMYPVAPVSPLLARLLGTPRVRALVVRPRSADLEELARLVEERKLRMPVTATYPLERVRDAHDDVARGHGCGKRVLVVREGGA